MLKAFDLGSDMTSFFVGGFIIFMIFAVLLTWVSPKRKAKRTRGKVDDRVVSFDGELID